VRTHNRGQERKVNRIIRKYGIVAPIIVDPNGFKAFKGDIRAASLVFQLMAKFVVLEEVASTRERDLLSDEEAAILERFIAKRTTGQK
jgi:hypothetical protein